MDLNDPILAALLAAETFAGAGLSCALYGGLLTAVYGEPREIRDATITERRHRLALRVAALLRA